MRRILPALLAATLLAQGCASSQTGTSSSATAAPASVVTATAKARIDSTLDAFVASGRLVGVSALVWEKGAEAYFGAFGMADREAGRPMKRDAIVQIYSMTKPITGVALMQLYEQGKFQLDDPLAKYLPEFADPKVYAGTDRLGRAATSFPPTRPITIRDITRHTAGFADEPDEPGVGPLYAPPTRSTATTRSRSSRRSSRACRSRSSRARAGRTASRSTCRPRSSSGSPASRSTRTCASTCSIRCACATRATSCPTSDRAASPRCISATTHGVLTRDAGRHATARSTRSPGRSTPGAFGLTSTLDDYMRFARMLLNGGELDGVRILKPETVRLMATNHLPDRVTDSSLLPSKGQVGFGIDFAVRVAPPKSAAENNGAVGEFFWDGAASTLFWVDPKNQLTAVLFTQMMPFDRVKLHKSFRDAVYGPITSPVQ